MSSLHAVADAPWVNAKEAESITGRSVRTLNRLVDAGRVNRRRNERGWEYDRESLLRIADVDMEPATDLLEASRQLIAQMGEPMRLYVDHLKLELAAMRARCEGLERLHTDLIKAREEALSQSFEREASATVIEAEQSRKTLVAARGLEVLEKALTSSGEAKLVGSLTVPQIDLLLGFGDTVLTPEQQRGLKALREQKAKAVVVNTEGSPVVTTEGEPA